MKIQKEEELIKLAASNSIKCLQNEHLYKTHKNKIKTHKWIAS